MATTKLRENFSFPFFPHFFRLAAAAASRSFSRLATVRRALLDLRPPHVGKSGKSAGKIQINKNQTHIFEIDLRRPQVQNLRKINNN